MIVCCGEALIDMIPVDQTDGKSAFSPHCGGAIFNTAIALGRLGADVGLISGISNDLFGEQLVQWLTESKVDVEYLIRNNRPTTLAFVQLKNGQATYSFFDENSAGRMLDQSDMPPALPDVEACYFGGISLASEPCGEAYTSFAQRQSVRSVVMLDPNIRASFIDNEDRYRDRLQRMLSISDIVKVSDEDLDWIYPEKTSHEDKLLKIRELGASIVILTKGADGSDAYFDSKDQVSVSADKSDVVDTVGAGDTFNAGFLAQLAELELLDKSSLKNIAESQLVSALEMAAKVAGVVVSRSGANPPWRDEL